MSERDRFDKFTERARKVLSFAQEEAQRFQHNYIGTEHLLQKGRQKAPSLESGDEWLSRLHILLMYAIIQTWIINMNNIPYI